MQRADTTSLRSHNSQVLLRALRDAQPASAKVLVERTGMRASTISRLLRALGVRGLVAPVGIRNDAGAGRPAELWGVDGSFGASIGLYLASNLVAGVATDLNGRLLASSVIPFRDPESQTPESLRSLLRQALDGLSASREAKDRPLVGVGIASMGLVDPERRALKYFNAVLDLDGFAPTPLHLENDANAVARGEATRGVLAGVRDAVVLYAHEGIGAGLLVGGRLHRGAGGAAGEVGYRGMQLLSNPLDGKERRLHERFRNGVCNIVNLLNPEALLLTGDLSMLPPAFVAQLAERIRTLTNPVAREVRLMVESCDPMGVAQHMASIVLDEEVFSRGSVLGIASQSKGAIAS